MKETNIKKYFYQILSIFAALLLSFSIAQIPVQAAAKPGTVKLSSIKATGILIIFKSMHNGILYKRLQK